MNTPHQQTTDSSSEPLCPLCKAAMIPRRRSALSRVKGFLLAYAAAMLALWVLPDLDTGTGTSLALLAGWGFYMMRARERPWCPRCWFRRG